MPTPQNEDEDYIPEPGEPISPGALRTVAAWLDTYDGMASAFFLQSRALGLLSPESVDRAIYIVSSDKVQSDLRRWADDLERSLNQPKET